jgi:hypothetical protein
MRVYEEDVFRSAKAKMNWITVIKSESPLQVSSVKHEMQFRVELKLFRCSNNITDWAALFNMVHTKSNEFKHDILRRIMGIG